MSKQQKTLLSIINRSYSHPTAEALFSEARLLIPRISLGTVYRNLNQLVETGQIRRLSFQGMPDRYDKTVPHDHLVCTECGKIVDIPVIECNVTVPLKGGYIERYESVAYGLCASCAFDARKKESNS